MLIEIPETFILGAASSAWQTEGWQGKKSGSGFFLGSMVSTRAFCLA